MNTPLCKIRCWEVGGTDKALLISTTPKDKAREGKSIWIPKSMLEHISRLVIPKVGEWREIVITLPEWLAEKKGLL